MHTRSPRKAARRLLKGSGRSRRHGRRRGRCDPTRARQGVQPGRRHTRSPRRAARQLLEMQQVRSAQQAALQAARPLRTHTRSPRQAAWLLREKQQSLITAVPGGTAGGEAAANAHALAQTGSVAAAPATALAEGAAARGTAGGGASASAHALASVAWCSRGSKSDRYRSRRQSRWQGRCGCTRARQSKL